MTAYRWRGVNPRGQQQFGQADWRDLPAEVEARFRSGWRFLIVCRGDGPVPPPAIGPAGLAAEIRPAPDTAKRSWWAETGEGQS